MLIGPDGKVAVAYDEVTPADHPGQVIADLDGFNLWDDVVTTWPARGGDAA